MASYGCLHVWAGLLGEEKSAGLLERILDQEKKANSLLSEIAISTSNREAMMELVTGGKK
jgi:ferritin-like metal-binding protein YciE